MTAEIRFETGTRVVNRHGVRGTVNGYWKGNLSVAIDGGGSDSGPAHHNAWRALTAEELAAETLAPSAPGSSELRSFAVCRSCGFTNSQHSPSCATLRTPAQHDALARVLGDATTVAAQTDATTDTDSLRAGAQGMAEAIRQRGGYTTLGCSCGAVSQSLTPYVFDERGRCDEAVLWGLVRIMEHTAQRDASHAITTLVGA